MVATPEPYTHYRTTDRARVEPGIYRVVGTDAESVVLLRVTDSDGLRVTTGEIRTVPREELYETFTDAENPDEGFRPGQVVDGLVEEVRTVARWLGRVFHRG